MSRSIDTDVLEGMYQEEFYIPSIDIASYNKGWNDCLDAIMNGEHTVDADHIRHGHWERVPIAEGSDKYYFKCNYCLNPSWSETEYCEMCGTKMDEVMK